MSKNPQSSVATSFVPTPNAQDALPEELESEDRRWQIEWARRNIED